MKIELTEVYGFTAALRGMRNPKESWAKSDTTFALSSGSWRLWAGCSLTDLKCLEYPRLGPKDLHLAQSLIKAGTDHSKFLRQIMVWSDWTLPLYVWSEADTYKVATVRNSCSTMHKLGTRFLLPQDFEDDELTENDLIKLNELGEQYREGKLSNFDLVRKMKKKLPSSYLLKATMTLSYQVLRNVYCGRHTHRLPEWSGPEGICAWIQSLPYGKELITVGVSQ